MSERGGGGREEADGADGVRGDVGGGRGGERGSMQIEISRGRDPQIPLIASTTYDATKRNSWKIPLT